MRIILALLVQEDNCPWFSSNYLQHVQQQKSEDYSGPTRTEGQFLLVDLKLSVTCV